MHHFFLRGAGQQVQQRGVWRGGIGRLVPVMQLDEIRAAQPNTCDPSHESLWDIRAGLGLPAVIAVQPICCSIKANMTWLSAQERAIMASI